MDGCSFFDHLPGERTHRRTFLKGIGAVTTTSVVGVSSVTATDETPNRVWRFDVSNLPASITYLSDPEGRQREAWELAKALHSVEQDASDALGPYSPDDIATVVSTSSAGRTDLRSFSRLVEVLHENNLAGIIDESMLNSVGQRADLVVRYAPLLGSVNNVLKKAEAFATAAEGQRRDEYLNFVLSIACLCLEAGLMWVGVPYKLAWNGTHRLFFARHGTLFRLGRYGGDRFVAFFMSEVHWELREALYDEITTERAKWVVDRVNSHREVPAYTRVRDDVESFVQDRSTFSVEDLQRYEFAKKYTDEVADTGSDLLGEVIESLPKDGGISSDTSSESLVLKSTMDWEQTAESENDGSLFGF